LAVATVLAVVVSSCSNPPVAAPPSVPAGHIVGTETLVATLRVPVTGSVKIRRLSKRYWSESVSSLRGHFSAMLQPGTYYLTGHDGDVYCTTVKATVRSGSSVDVAIDCTIP
jgi:hypothetical protein